MALGKQIKVVLTLDDAGFSQKIIGATQQSNALKEGFNKLSKDTEALESTVAGLGRQLLKSGSGFDTMQRQLNVSITANTKATASIKALESATAKNAKTTESAAQKAINARIQALGAETSTNAQLIAKRQQYLNQLAALEREYEAKALGQRVRADALRAKKKTGSSADANAELRVGQGYTNSAAVIRREIADTQRLLSLKAAESQANMRKIDMLRQQLGVLNSVADSNRRAVEAARAGAEQQTDILRRQVQARREADREMQRSHQETTRMRISQAREAAAEEQRQAQMVGEMWKGMAQMYAGSKIGEGLGKSLNKADDYNRVLERVDSFGLDGSKGRERVLGVAQNVEKSNPNLSKTEALKLTMSVVAGAVSTDTKMLNKIVPEIAKMMTVMTRQFPEQAHNLEDFGRNIMGVMEARGIVDNPQKMLETLDGLSRALISTQGKMSVQDYETISRRGGAGNSLFKDNESILYDIAAASQLKVMGGGSGGGGGGVSTYANMQKQAALRAQGGVRETVFGLKNQIEFGIIDKKQVMEANGGKIPGRMYTTTRYANSENADKNMTKFAMELVNGVKKKLANLPEKDMRFFNPGDDRKDDNVLAAAFGRFADKTWQNGSGREFYKMFATNAAQHRVTAEVDASNAAPTYGESNAVAMNSWEVSVNKTKAALTDLGVVVGNQLIPVLQPLLANVTDLVHAMAEFGNNNPMAAKLAAIGAAALGTTLSFKAMTGIYGTIGTLSGGLRTLAGSSMTTAGAAGTLAGATQRVNAAQMQSLQNTARVTQAQRQFAQAQMAAAKATVANSTGMARLSAVQNVLLPAQRNMSTATTAAAGAQLALQRAQAASTIGARAMAGTTRVLAGAMGMLGGPIGMIITGLTVATMAWSMFGNAASEAQKKAKAASENSAEAVQNTVKRLKDDIVVMNKGENAPIVDNEMAEIAKLKKARDLKEKELATLNATPARTDGGELARMSRIGQMSDELKVEKKAITDREAALNELSDLAIKSAKRRKEKEETEAAEMQKRIDAQLKAGAKFNLPQPGDDDTATTDISDAFEEKGDKKKNKKEKRDYIDPLTRALEETKGKVEAGKTALSALKFGVEELSDIREQVEEELEGKRKGGVFNKDRDKNKQVAKNDPRYLALVEETFQLRVQAEQKKALEFANERVVSSTMEVDAAMERLAGNGTEKQTDAFRALSRELEKAEERLGAGAIGFNEWSAAKARALGAQAQSDAVNTAADYQISNREDKADLAGTESERERAKLAVAAAAEDRKYQLRIDTLRRTEQAEIAAMTRANASEEAKNAIVARYAAAREQLETQYADRRAIRTEQEVRALETPLDSMTRQWGDTYSAINDIQANAANNFVSMLTSSLGTGRMEVKGFITGILTDIANAKLKEVLAEPLKGVLNQGASMLMGSVFGAKGATGAGGEAAAAAQAIAASTASTTADTAAASASTALGTTIMSQVIPALQMFTSQMMQGSGSGIGSSIGKLIGAGAGAYAPIGNPIGAPGAIPNVMFANGGVMTEFGEMQLRKYSKGGIANKPQVAMYGEGDQNEAFVPLPDGRTIPVTMSGGGQGQAAANVQVNVINQTSQAVNAQQGNARFDGKQMILDVVLSAATAPGSFRSGMKDAMK